MFPYEPRFQDSELDSSTWNLNAKETCHYINQSGIIDVPGIIDDKAGENGIDEVDKSLTQINDDDVEYIQGVCWPGMHACSWAAL